MFFNTTIISVQTTCIVKSDKYFNVLAQINTKK